MLTARAHQGVEDTELLRMALEGIGSEEASPLRSDLPGCRAIRTSLRKSCCLLRANSPEKVRSRLGADEAGVAEGGVRVAVQLLELVLGELLHAMTCRVSARRTTA